MAPLKNRESWRPSASWNCSVSFMVAGYPVENLISNVTHQSNATLHIWLLSDFFSNKFFFNLVLKLHFMWLTTVTLTFCGCFLSLTYSLLINKLYTIQSHLNHFPVYTENTVEFPALRVVLHDDVIMAEGFITLHMVRKKKVNQSLGGKPVWSKFSAQVKVNNYRFLLQTSGFDSQMNAA